MAEARELTPPATLVASRGLWGLVSDRFGWSLRPIGYSSPRPADDG